MTPGDGRVEVIFDWGIKFESMKVRVKKLTIFTLSRTGLIVDSFDERRIGSSWILNDAGKVFDFGSCGRWRSRRGFRLIGEADVDLDFSGWTSRRWFRQTVNFLDEFAGCLEPFYAMSDKSRRRELQINQQEVQRREIDGLSKKLSVSLTKFFRFNCKNFFFASENFIFTLKGS